MRPSCSIAVIGILWALALPASGLEIMYAGTGSGPVNGALGTVDIATGAFTFIGDPTTSSTKANLVGISFDSTGRLFGSVVDGDNGMSTLIEINPNDGTLLSTIGLIHDVATDVDNDVRIVDLATQPGTDTLFGIDSSAVLWTINKSDASATKVGDTGLFRGGIAFGPDGTLYLATVASSLLTRLDPATGQTIGSLIPMNDCIDGLAARPSDGALFGTACDSNTIYSIDKTTGDLTALGPDPDYDTADLAFRIGPAGLQAPALSSAAIAALGACLAVVGVALLARRRSRPRSLPARG